MKNKINVSELLKDCPKDMELDCVMYEDVYFDHVDELNIIHCYIQNEGFKTSITFNQHGTPHSDVKSKCVIFPKGKNTWEGFQRPFKDGDIIYNRFRKKICIYYLFEDQVPRIKGCRYNESNSHQFEKLEYPMPIALQDYRLATGEEKVKFFKAIENNGYQWNPETKTLVKLPKFKDGDVVVDDSGALFIYKQIHPLYNKPYADFYCGLTSELRSFVIKAGELQRCGEINSLRYATEEEKEELFNAINDNGYCWNDESKTLEKLVKPKPKPCFKSGDKIRHKKDKTIIKTIGYLDKDSYALYDGHMLFFSEQDQYELIPNKFDISKLKPFDEVLFRMHDKDTWCNGFYSFYKNKRHVVNSVTITKQCIPYKGNEHLLNTTDKCNEFYETWEK